MDGWIETYNRRAVEDGDCVECELLIYTVTDGVQLHVEDYGRGMKLIDI